MIYYVGIENGKIISKNKITNDIELSENYKTITKELYDSIGDIPCSFVENQEGIISIEHIELQPELTPSLTVQEQLDTMKEAIDFLIMGGM